MTGRGGHGEAGQGAPGRPADVYQRYDLERHGESRTGRQLREQVEQEHREQYGPFAPFVAGPGDERVDDLLDRQAAQLRAGVLTRSAPAGPAVHYLGIPHQRLYDGVHQGVDPAVVGDMGALWTDLGNRLATFHQAIASAITTSEADWEGEAGDRARRSLAELGNRAGETGVSAQLAGTLFTQQSRALADAKNAVPPPPAEVFDVDAASERLMRITDPVQLARQAAADRAVFEQQERDHREAARVIELYDRTVAQTAAAQPAFAPAPTAPRQPEEPPRPTPPRADDPVAPRPAPPPVVDGTTKTSTSRPATRPGPSTVDTQGVGPGGGTTQTSGTGSAYAPLPAARTGPGAPPPGGLPGPNRGAPVAGRTGGGPGGRASGGGAGGGRVGGGGLGGTGGPGVGPGGAAAARGLGAGGRTGIGPGAGSGVAPGGTGGRGGGGGGRGPVGAGMAGLGGGVPGRSRDEDDIEHQTPSYLLEPDPDEVFGAGGTTAPPVIGDWDR
ncbi:hypothetical protein [Saccharothrix australiensis]|uniref:PPE family protein n=1 Tax=Saccharothrix australiensis TaxID=2072 RepID=A0A495WBY2_9PSEU|nr:hypothetical protein [Saccharothrix australiensis]RKT57338.1 hypothetical protein C8E97_6057 [Saccharothrix australiensis]